MVMIKAVQQTTPFRQVAIGVVLRFHLHSQPAQPGPAQCSDSSFRPSPQPMKFCSGPAAGLPISHKMLT